MTRKEKDRVAAALWAEPGVIKHALPFTRAIHIAVHVASLSKSPAGTFREDQRNSEDDR